MTTQRPKEYVYRCFSEDGRLLYVGATCDVIQRIATHRSGWWGWALHTYEVAGPFSSSAATPAEERRSIASENPRFNRHGRWAQRAAWDADDYRDFYDAIRHGAFSGYQKSRMATTADECLRRFGVDITTTQKEAVS